MFKEEEARGMAVVPVGTAVENDIALRITPVGGRQVEAPDVSELPTEVIAEALQAGIVILPPDPNEGRQQYVGELSAWGYEVPLGVGELPDILLAAMEWLEALMERWKEMRRAGE
jgi:hypothetical protein